MNLLVFHTNMSHKSTCTYSSLVSPPFSFIPRTSALDLLSCALAVFGIVAVVVICLDLATGDHQGHGFVLLRMYADLKMLFAVHASCVVYASLDEAMCVWGWGFGTIGLVWIVKL